MSPGGVAVRRTAVERATALVGFAPPDPVDVEDFLRGVLESEEGEGALALDALVLPSVAARDVSGRVYYEVSARFEGEGVAVRVYADCSGDPEDPFADSRAESANVGWGASNDLLRRAYAALARGPLAEYAGDPDGLLSDVYGGVSAPHGSPASALARLVGVLDLPSAEVLLATRVADELADGLPVEWMLRRGTRPAR